MHLTSSTQHHTTSHHVISGTPEETFGCMLSDTQEEGGGGETVTRVVLLYFPTEPEKTAWMQAITNAIQEQKNPRKEGGRFTFAVPVGSALERD